MSAIERCRTAALGGHVACCDGVRPYADRLQLLHRQAVGRKKDDLRPLHMIEATPTATM
jgi:hypothetical protein